ncbi:MAG: hypothetical protein Q8R92_12420 [Deltaproteobacteria bacterium]|nr:hypothetical protein [Deltaproteobacteria bacterium]
MRRCPRCFSVYDDRTAHCGPCDAPTEPYTERRESPPPAPPIRTGAIEVSVPGAPGSPVSAPQASDEDDLPAEVILAEADADWAERAAEALARAGIAAKRIISESESDVVLLVVQAADQDRAIDVIGEALDEPPALSREELRPPDEAADESEPAPENERWDDPAVSGPPDDLPPRSLDPDQAALCPECGESYRAGFEWCADCDVPLVPAGGGRGA